MELIQSTRKALKKKIRETVDRVGPQVFKNFDKMRLIMFNPESSQRGEDDTGKKMKKSYSLNKFGDSDHL